MIKKKNYKQQEHFTKLHTFTVYSPQNGGTKYMVYYKRYRQEQPQKKANLYNVMNNKEVSEQKQELVRYPKDRTLELMSFDGSLQFLRKYLRKVGKIRKIEYGQAVYKQSKIWTAICIFKFQFDLVKCFREDFLQNLMREQSFQISKATTEEDRQQARIDLIQKHMGEQLKNKVEKLEKMREGGYEVITDMYGQYRLDYEANQKWVQNLPQVKKKLKNAKKNLNQEPQQNQ